MKSMAIKMVSQLILLGHLFISTVSCRVFFNIVEEEWFPHGTILYEDKEDPRGFVTDLDGNKPQDGTGRTNFVP